MEMFISGIIFVYLIVYRCIQQSAEAQTQASTLNICVLLRLFTDAVARRFRCKRSRSMAVASNRPHTTHVSVLHLLFGKGQEYTVTVRTKTGPPYDPVFSSPLTTTRRIRKSDR